MTAAPIILSEFNITRVYEILSTHGLVLLKNQKLSVIDQEQLLKQHFLLNPEYQNSIDEIKDLFVSGSNLILRVTAQVNENNIPGAFNNAEGLPWHSDNPTPIEDRLLTWLYGAENTNGSSTIYCNTNLAFNNLPHDLKTLAKSLIAHTTNRFIYKNNRSYIMPLYCHSGLGQYSWSFPFMQIKYFEGYSIEESLALIDTLKEYVLKDEYCYTHNWEDDDLIISNEKILIHKRPAYDKMDQRVLHKGTMGFLDIM